MPVVKKTLPPESGRHLELVSVLAEELQRGSSGGPGPAEAPYIIEEEQRGGFFHITVLWDEWKDVTPEERGRIIMDAYQQQRSNDVAQISMALGLTSKEAERIGVNQ